MKRRHAMLGLALATLGLTTKNAFAFISAGVGRGGSRSGTSGNRGIRDTGRGLSDDEKRGGNNRGRGRGQKSRADKTTGAGRPEPGSFYDRRGTGNVE